MEGKNYRREEFRIKKIVKRNYSESGPKSNILENNEMFLANLNKNELKVLGLNKVKKQGMLLVV